VLTFGLSSNIKELVKY